MADYEIPENTPSRAVGVQFGANETLLGVADRLIDDAANRTGSDAGLALVDAPEARFRSSASRIISTRCSRAAI